MLALCPEHPKRDQNPKLTFLSEMMRIPVCFIWEFPLPPPPRDFTFTVLPFMQVYECLPANLLLGVTLMDQYLIQGGVELLLVPSCYGNQKCSCANLIGHQVQTQPLPRTLSNRQLITFSQSSLLCLIRGTFCIIFITTKHLQSKIERCNALQKLSRCLLT